MFGPSSSKPLTRGEKWTTAILLTLILSLFSIDIVIDFSTLKLSALFIILLWVPLLVTHEAGHAIMARLLGFHVVRCTKPVEFVFPKFTNDPAGQVPRTPDHKEKYPNYPDPDHFLRSTQKLFFRAPELRHMRMGQVIRYFAPAPRPGRPPPALQLRERCQ